MGGEEREVSEDTSPAPLRRRATRGLLAYSVCPWGEWACLCGWRGRGGPQKEREPGLGRDFGEQAAGVDGGHLRRDGGRLLRVEAFGPLSRAGEQRCGGPSPPG